MLATAADAVLAGQLASRLGFIDQVFASDGQRNLKGSEKAAMLRQLFPAGFIYAGDSAADLKVWRHASGIVLVNARQLGRRRGARAGKADTGIVGPRWIVTSGSRLEDIRSDPHNTPAKVYGLQRGLSGAGETFMTWAWFCVLAAIVVGIAIFAVWRRPSRPRRDYTGLKHHAKVHSFRISTAILAWALIVAAFYYRPDLLKWALRTITHGIETIGDFFLRRGAIGQK